MGDNLLKKSEKMTWWTGVDVDYGKETIHIDTVYDVLDKFCRVPERPFSAPRRMPISGIYKIKGVGDVLAGRVEQGVVKQVGKCSKFGILEIFTEIAEKRVGKCSKFGILEIFTKNAEKKDDHKKLYERFGKCSEFGILEIFTKNVENNDYYKKFYEQFGRYSKLGIPEIFTKIAEKKVGKCLKFGILETFAEIAEKKVGKCLKFGIL